MDNQTFFLIIVIIIIYYIGWKGLIEQICQNKHEQNIIDVYIRDEHVDHVNHANYEQFNTMGPHVNIGNSMNFIEEKTEYSSPINKALYNSLVPDFEPSRLNINPDLNLYGYALDTPGSLDQYYMKRGFMNPEKGYQFANSNNTENFGCLCKKKYIN
jgi:hypothetical protein